MKKMLSFISALAMCAVMTAPMFSMADDENGTNQTPVVDEGGGEEDSGTGSDTTPTPNPDDEGGDDGDSTQTEASTPIETETTTTTTAAFHYETIEWETEDKSSNVLVETKIPSTYIVIIPDGSIELDKNGEAKDISVSAKKVMINTGETLKISVESKNKGKLKDEVEGSTAAPLTYTLTPEGAAALDLESTTPVEVLSVAAGEHTTESNPAAKPMKLQVTGTPNMSGTYKDTLTFTVGVGKVSVAE